MSQPRDSKGRFMKKSQTNTNNTNNTDQPQQNEVIGLKGFDMDLCCRGTQFKEHEHYQVYGYIKRCDHGLHFCTSPLDTFGYYKPANSRYAIVKGSGTVDQATGIDSSFLCSDTKVAASDLFIKQELSLDTLVYGLIASVSGLEMYDQEGYHCSGIFDSKIRYRYVAVSHREARCYDDTQDILVINNSVYISADVKGYAGHSRGSAHHRAACAIACRRTSIAYADLAITLEKDSVAKGHVAMAQGHYSIASGSRYALTMGSGCAAMTTAADSVAVCGDRSKIVLYGDNSVGVVGEGSVAEVYGKHCMLVLTRTCYRFKAEKPDLFILRDGTVLTGRGTDSGVYLIAGKDIESTELYKNTPVYTAQQISNAFKKARAKAKAKASK